MARFIPYQSSRSIIEPTKETVDALESVIRWAESEVPGKLKTNMNELVYYMALINQRFARKMSFGPLDSSGGRSDLAWRTPVRRITENYYLGWKVKQVRPAVWQLYNDSREAYFIEFGINWLGAGRRVRRPVRKLTLRQTLTFMMTTTAYHRIWADIFVSRNRSNLGFSQIVNAPGGGHRTWISGINYGEAQKSTGIGPVQQGSRGFRIPNRGPRGFQGRLPGRRLP